MIAAREGNAEVVVLGEAVALEHVRPGEAEGGHDRGAAVLHLDAERVARLNGLVQVVEADGGEERAQELLGVRVALLHDQRDPGSGLLQHLLHGLVAQQVGQPHVLVLDAVAQLQVGGDGLAVAALVGEVRLPEEEPARRAQTAVRGEREQQQRAGTLRHRGRATPGGAVVGGRGSRGNARQPRPELGAAAGEAEARGRREPDPVCQAARRAALGGSDPGEQSETRLGPRQSFLGLFFMQIWRWRRGAREEPEGRNPRRAGHRSLGLVFR